MMLELSLSRTYFHGPQSVRTIDVLLYLLNCVQQISCFLVILLGRVAQKVGHLTRKSGVLGSKPGLATYFRFSFRFFKNGSCQLLAKVCARSTG